MFLIDIQLGDLGLLNSGTTSRQRIRLPIIEYTDKTFLSHVF